MTQYLVSRMAEVTFAFMVGRINSLPKGSTWHAPILDEHAKVFSNKADATAYCTKMNRALHDPNKNTIDISPYTDYVVVPIGAKKAKVSVKR